MKKTKKIAILFSPLFLLVAFILLTDPYKLPLALLLAPFLLIGVGCYYVLRTFLSLTPMSKRKSKFISWTITAVLLLTVLLQSIRQLSAKDLLIMVVFLVGITFYVRRIDV